ncbi:putative COQ4 protein, responsible for restoring ubiquinone biosynthesis [Amylocystis lapponica]|nr:putative COQ4 protein, responsible for restoring ubiquinone biosynthesis [Amylocystis lapponica]
MSVTRLALRRSALPRPSRTIPTCFNRNVSTKPAYERHIPLNWLESSILVVVSTFVSLANPRRGDMVTALGDIASEPVLPRLRDKMLASAEGRRILKERPRVDYVDDPEFAYVVQRYRECHDFYHCICSLPVNVESELALKFFEFANLGLPIAGISAAFGHLRLTYTKRARLFREFVPWAVQCGSSAQSLITVYWEERWDQNVDEIKRELGIWDPPEARWSKPLSEAKAAAEKRQQDAEAQLTKTP